MILNALSTPATCVTDMHFHTERAGFPDQVIVFRGGSDSCIILDEALLLT